MWWPLRLPRARGKRKGHHIYKPYAARLPENNRGTGCCPFHHLVKVIKRDVHAACNVKQGRNAMKRFFGHLRIVVCLVVLLLAATLSLVSVPRAYAASNTITADFSVGVDHPLVKTKFNLFNTFKRTQADFDRDVALLSELKAQTMRIDFELGEPYGQDASAVGGTASNLTYDFSLIDHESNALLAHGVTPYWDYTYTPYPLQTVTSSCNVSGNYTCGYYQPPL